MIRRKKPDLEAMAREIDEAREDQAKAREARKSVEAGRPRVESIVSYLEERRRVNGFGGDFEITTRRLPSASAVREAATATTTPQQQPQQPQQPQQGPRRSPGFGMTERHRGMT